MFWLGLLKCSCDTTPHSSGDVLTLLSTITEEIKYEQDAAVPNATAFPSCHRMEAHSFTWTAAWAALQHLHWSCDYLCLMALHHVPPTFEPYFLRWDCPTDSDSIDLPSCLDLPFSSTCCVFGLQLNSSYTLHIWCWTQVLTSLWWLYFQLWSPVNLVIVDQAEMYYQNTHNQEENKKKFIQFLWKLFNRQFWNGQTSVDQNMNRSDSL